MNKTFMTAAALALTSCASMTTGTTQTVAVASDPPGATCTLSNAFGHWQVTTPATITIHRATKPLAVACTKDGFSDTAQEIKAKQAHAVSLAAGGGVVGALLGAAIDGSNGAAGEYPAQVSVAMERRP